MELAGWVNNCPQGVFIEVEGKRAALEEFLSRLGAEKPPQSFIQSLETWWLDAVGFGGFGIRASEQGRAKSALVMPDIATCADCLAEVFDPQNRRYLYPFTNCTNCGPRFSILESLPYDRANTSMKRFAMCPQCQAEYDNPRDRRFHAQPNACPVCGPRLELWDGEGQVLVEGDDGSRRHSLESCSAPTFPRAEGCAPAARDSVLARAAEGIRAGKIVAVKGLGGFHLMVAAGNDVAVARLRERKHREEKPFALMFPSLGTVRGVCEVSPLEERLLRSPEAPIVLLQRLRLPDCSGVSNAAAPGNPNLGVMVPYTPLHHLLMASVGGPVVATSGNLSDEPICIDEREALERLRGIADLFLVHNRPIVRHVDDSIVRVMMNRELVLRRARGYAPLPVLVRSDQVRSAECGIRSEDETRETQHTCDETPEMNSALPTPRTVLGVGAHLKNAIALAVGPQVFISQHIGDLETAQAYDAFRKVTVDLQGLYDAPASLIVSDAHPDYLSSKFAQSASVPCRTVQHHVAHVLSCMAENELRPPVLGVSWDGTGYGLDGTVWGGEFFRITNDGFERVAHFRQFRLPGGEQAVREPRRSALGLLYETYGEAAFAQSNLATIGAFSSTEKVSLKAMLGRRLNSPLTSSVGRLFDGVASLVGLRQKAHFEGQAAMEMEFVAREDLVSASYDLAMDKTSSPIVLDWRPGLRAVQKDLATGVPAGTISARFHNMLVEFILEVARRIGCERVVLSGGCFQNRYLTERTIRRLKGKGFRPYWHQRIPPNDGGICLGQVVAARMWKV
jgi:hydrogenase maturation protein HypF